MANMYEDTVSDFDLNFLQPIHNVNTSRIDKQRQSIINVKNKIIASHCLLQKFYLQRDKLDVTESLLLSSKEECKQACLDYKITLEKCIQIEKDSHKLKEVNQELEQKMIHLHNQCEAMKSHARQLQELVQENESVIEALKIEKELEKKSVKAYEKNLAGIEKEREAYLKDIQWMRDVILGKKKSKSCKDILNKYKHLKGFDDNSESDNSGDESYFHDSPLGSPINNELQNKEEVIFGDKIRQGAIYQSNTNSIIKEKKINDNDFDSCNEEVVSEDTGRGSSLAFSDADKFFNSPEVVYGPEVHKNIENIVVNHVDVGTSPVRFDENFISSPNIFDDEALLSDNTADNNRRSPEYFITDIPFSTEIVTIKEKRQLVDTSTSPIHFITDMVHISTSPIVFETTESLECPAADNLKSQIKSVVISNDLPKVNSTVPCHMNVDTISSGNELEISTDSLKRNCLEHNHSKKLCDEPNNDREVEMILNNMRLEYDLITPIPRTPATSRKPERKESNLLNKQIDNQNHITCPDAMKIREENKGLHENIAFLCKEIMLIKNILKIKTLKNSENAQNFNRESCNLFNDSSQSESLILTDDMPLTDVCSNNGELLCSNSELNLLSTSSKLSKSVEERGHCIDAERYITESMQQKGREKLVLENEKTSDVEVIQTTYTNSEEDDCRLQSSTDIVFDNNKLRDIHVNDANNLCTLNNNQSQQDHDEDTRDINNIQDIEDTNYGLRFNHQRSNNCTFIRKSRKPTKLDRFKKKILPKSKISRINSPTRRKLRKTARLLPISNKEQTNKSLANLNNKEAYDKALQVMAEIKSKTKQDFRKPISKLAKRANRKPPNENITNKNNHNDTMCQSQKDESNLERMSPIKENILPSSLDPITLLCPETKCDILPGSQKINAQSSPQAKNFESDYLSTSNGVKTTRSRSTISDVNAEYTPKKKIIECDNNNQINTNTPKISRRRKRVDSNSSDVSCKRMLRSSNSEKTKSTKLVQDLNDAEWENRKETIDYSDLDVFSSNTEVIVETKNVHSDINKATIEKSSDDCNKIESNNIELSKDMKRRSKRLSSNSSDVKCKRLLRSSNLEIVNNNLDNSYENSLKTDNLKKQKLNVGDNQENNFAASSSITDNMTTITSDKDSNVYIGQSNSNSYATSKNDLSKSILCKMIATHGRRVFKFTSQKVSDTIANTICKKIENSIAGILEAPSDKIQSTITKFVEEIRELSKKSLLAGLMKHLQDPERKLELYNKVNCHASVAMTKREQIILSALKQINTPESNIVNDLLSNIEFALFRLNQSPEFDTIESLSHFYAATCRLFHMKYRLKTFLLDAMYCLQYKAVALIKQCLTTWTHILPLAHMKYAKTPLITCIVYLLHFYKCERDRFKRVQDIRWILHKKYLYNFSEWNETKILEMFSNAINSVKDDPAEKNMLRIALLIFAKRHGPKWCQRNIVNNMLLPLIESEKTAEKVKIFCIRILGAIVKPYPGDMKVHCEIIVSQLLDMLDQENMSHGIKEAIFTSLIYMSKHNPPRVTQALLSWQPEKISSELENLLKVYVREKPIKAWKTILSKIYV